MPFEAQADREYARNVGYQYQDQEWILSDRDVWYKNPFYAGTPGRHPEDDSHENDDLGDNYPEPPEQYSEEFEIPL